jgi:hypothetical protein
MTDEEMAALPLRIDPEILARSEISTWRTDAGDIDLLADIPARHRDRRTYDDLLPHSSRLDAGGVSVLVASLDDVIGSKQWLNRDKDRAALPELLELSDPRSPDKQSEA